MEISHYTARKQIGFKLPQDAFDALALMEERRPGMFRNQPSLAASLLRLDNFVCASLGLTRSRTVFIDFDTSHDEEVPAVDQAAEIISSHAEVALAVERFLPGALGHGYVCFHQLDGNGILIDRYSAVPAGRVVHYDDHFLVLADRATGQGSVHFVKNGRPAWTRLDSIPASLSSLWPGFTGQAATEEPLPTTKLDAVTNWIMNEAYVPDLERAAGYDISSHSLEAMVTSGRIAYADRDIIVSTSGQRMTVHHEIDGRYSVKILEGEEFSAFARLAATPGLDPLDHENPAREWLDGVISERCLRLAERENSDAARLRA
jgi:hypothetical protein